MILFCEHQESADSCILPWDDTPRCVQQTQISPQNTVRTPSVNWTMHPLDFIKQGTHQCGPQIHIGQGVR